MSCETETVQLGAIGANIIVTVEEDGEVIDALETVTAKSLVFRKPNGVGITKTADFVTDGTDGKLKYVTESGFLDVKGTWRIQAQLTFPGSGYSGPTEVGTFQVLANV